MFLHLERAMLFLKLKIKIKMLSSLSVSVHKYIISRSLRNSLANRDRLDGARPVREPLVFANILQT